MVSVLLQDMGGLMVKLNLTEKIGSRDLEYYLTGFGQFGVLSGKSIQCLI